MTIRSQLLLSLIGAMLACTLLAGAAVYWQLLSEANDLFDYELRALAIAVPTRGTAAAAAALRGGPGEPVVIQVWDASGQLVYSSAPQPLPALAAPGNGDVTAQGAQWRAYLAERRGERVQVAQARSGRTALAAGVAMRSLMPFLLLLPVLALLICLFVSRGLAPLGRLAALVARRSPGALDAFPAAGQPPELMPMVTALNDLLRQLGGALDSQRTFLADAAHELRSPLTALRLQIQLAERADDGPQRSAAFGKLEERLERAIRLVQQLMVAARQDSSRSGRPLERVDLLDLARRCVADRYVTASAKGIDLGIPKRAIRATVDGYAEDLQILLGNLIDNALRYTQSGGWVDVIVERDQNLLCLRVMDNGPGIPVHDRSRVFRRFHRGEGHEEWGSGLGLAIVASIAAAHGAAVTLDDNPAGCGLCVTVWFDAVQLHGCAAGIDPLMVA